MTSSDSLTNMESELQAQREFRTKVNAAARNGDALLLLMLLLFFPFGRNGFSWGWSLMAIVAVSGTVFIRIWRWSHNRKLSSPDESLPEVIKDSLSHVDTEIWLYRHAYWYRYIPICLSIIAYYAHFLLSAAAEKGLPIVGGTGDVAIAILIVGISLLLVAVVQRYFFSIGTKGALAKLEARRQKLLARLTTLEAERRVRSQ